MRWWGVAMEWRKETEVLVACAKKNQVGGNSGAVLSCGRKEEDWMLPYRLKIQGDFLRFPTWARGGGREDPPKNVVPLPEAIFHNRGKENFPKLPLPKRTKNSAFKQTYRGKKLLFFKILQKNLKRQNFLPIPFPYPGQCYSSPSLKQFL